jgi:hypothetical protein
LLELGCKTGQGLSFGKAMPVDEVLGGGRHASARCSPVTLPSGRVFATGRFAECADTN